jgi:hypothetical protein
MSEVLPECQTQWLDAVVDRADSDDSIYTARPSSGADMDDLADPAGQNERAKDIYGQACKIMIGDYG